eukprot:gene6796-13763_t
MESQEPSGWLQMLGEVGSENNSGPNFSFQFPTEVQCDEAAEEEYCTSDLLSSPDKDTKMSFNLFLKDFTLNQIDDKEIFQDISQEPNDNLFFSILSEQQLCFDNSGDSQSHMLPDFEAAFKDQEIVTILSAPFVGNDNDVRSISHNVEELEPKNPESIKVTNLDNKPSTVIRTLDTAGTFTIDTVLGLSSCCMSTATNAAQAGALVASVAGDIISSIPVISTVAGFATESLLFTADRAQQLVDRCAIDLEADSPEVIYLRGLSNDADWDSENLRQRALLPSLSWLDRQLLHQTRDLYSTVVVAPLRVITDSANEISSKIKHKGDVINGIMEEEKTNDRSRLTQLDAAANTAAAENSYLTVTVTGTLISPKPIETVHDSIHHWLAKEAAGGDEEAQYAFSRRCSRPTYQESIACTACGKMFGVSLFRHHCRCCGLSFCGNHSGQSRPLPRYGLPLAVRVCEPCAGRVDAECREDLILWRVLRTQSFLRGDLLPYFSTDVDRSVDKAMRVAEGTLYVVRNTLSLNYYAKLSLNAVDLLSRYGMSGLTGVLLRKDFVEAAETLKRVSSLEVQHPLSLHELTACTYYKLALDRGLRGCDPEGEHCMHLHQHQHLEGNNDAGINASGIFLNGIEDNDSYVPDIEIDEAIRYAPFALAFVYEEQSTEMQRLAAQQGYQTIFVHTDAAPEKPAFALFASTSTSTMSQKHAILSVRGTASLQDVVTDVRTLPQRFQPPEFIIDRALSTRSSDIFNASPADTQIVSFDPANRDVETPWTAEQWEWDAVPEAESYVCGGIFRAALWVLEEVGPALMELHRSGTRIVFVGHSLGAAVCVLMTALLRTRVPGLRCWAYGCPSCVDAQLADELRDEGVLTSVVLHDDVVPRLTPSSIRSLMKDLLVFREQVFRHVEDDWTDVLHRASRLWSPRWREETSSSYHKTSSKQSQTQTKTQTQTAADLYSPSSNEEMVLSDELSCGDVAVGGDPVHVAERPLAHVWLPGRVLHIYAHRGLYKISAVPRTFVSLRRIEVQGNIFDNHKSRAIMEALLEVRSVRRASKEAPMWTPFSASGVCERCRAAFTWHTTCQGRAQEMRERHNCRCCGALVCGPCSLHREPVPSLGLRTPSRVCDQCFYAGRHSET